MQPLKAVVWEMSVKHAENEKGPIIWVLKQTLDNKRRAADIIGSDRASLLRKLSRYRMA